MDVKDTSVKAVDNPGVERDDPVVEPVQPGLALAHDLRLERTVAVPGHRQVHRPDLSQHRLAAGQDTPAAIQHSMGIGTATCEHG